MEAHGDVAVRNPVLLSTGPGESDRASYLVSSISIAVEGGLHFHCLKRLHSVHVYVSYRSPTR